MSTTGQHEFHPNAELLSAFAGHALNQVERRQVLAHLAVCRRCRDVIALAQQAVAADEMAMEEVELEEAAIPAAVTAVAVAAAAPVPAARASRRRRTWWKGWRVAWVPVAALAAAAGFAVYIHLARVERNAEVAKNTPTTTVVPPALSQNETAEKPAPQEQTKELPAAPPAAGPHAAQKTPAGSAGALADRRTALAAPEVTVLPPVPAESAQIEAEQSSVRTASAEQPTELRGAAGSQALYKSALAPPPPQPLPAERKRKAADRERQTETAVARDRLEAVSATPPPTGQNANLAIAAEATAPAQPHGEAHGGPVAAFGGFKGTQAYGSFARAGIHLPSGLDVASIASQNHRILAIDKGGSVFLSDDGGGAWRDVTPQWTGRAVLVRTRTIQASGAAPAPAAESSAPAAAAAPSAPSAALVFELVNDQNEVWQSTDGLAWAAMPKPE